MKSKYLKVLSLFLILFSCLFVTGCGKYGEKDVVKDLESKQKKAKAYYVKGDLEIVNNDDVYNYKVEVSYKKEDNYKVSLTNTANDHEQIILKNSEGVYVLTPALNKSYKFQSDWPYDNSQVYLLESIVKDIKNDSKRKFKETKNGYIIETKVDYPNNEKLVKQRINLDKKLKIKKIQVMDKNNISQITMKFNKIDYSPTFKKDYFELNSAMESAKTVEETEETSKLEDTIYPLVLPDGTKLTNEEKVKKDNGERVIMTFEGDKSFLLVEETANKEEDFTVIPTYGEPYRLMDSYGVMTDESLTWSSNGIDYYLVSEAMSQDELVEVAQSISAIPTMK